MWGGKDFLPEKLANPLLCFIVKGGGKKRVGLYGKKHQKKEMVAKMNRNGPSFSLFLSGDGKSGGGGGTLAKLSPLPPSFLLLLSWNVLNPLREKAASFPSTTFLTRT